MVLLDPPVPVIPRNWYCEQRAGAEICLAANRLAAWTVTAIHARYLAEHPHRIGTGKEILRAFHVDLKGNGLVPDLARVIVCQQPGGRWCIKAGEQEYLDSLILHQLPLREIRDLNGECCRYKPGGQAEKIAECEVRVEPQPLP